MAPKVAKATRKEAGSSKRPLAAPRVEDQSKMWSVMCIELKGDEDEYDSEDLGTPEDVG